ncbi:MAG TPA: putative metalloprotease CJM1_0395 family protein [Anaeromyxobacteraceae bacterium]
MVLPAGQVDPTRVAGASEPRLGRPEPVSGGGRSVPGDRTTLSDEALDEVRKLEGRDREVRAHEAAHQAAGGALAGGATFTYQLGPDGHSYAVGGEVPIRSAGGGSAEADIAAARQVRAAALAPGDPSAQDLAVAAAATQQEQLAVARKAREAYGAHRVQAPSRRSGATAP